MIKYKFITGMLCFYSFSLQADLPGAPTSTKPMIQSPTPQAQPKSTQPKHPTGPAYHPKTIIKPELPPMIKPFGMPGVVGLAYGKWEGTDYLGYLSNNIGISVEIVKGQNVPQVSSDSSIEGALAGVFSKENINPNAEVVEGPPLPFFHMLILIYAIDKDKFVVFGNGRLFEQIQVVRKDFVPSGVWQGITWESQDIAIATGEQLDAQIKDVAEKVATTFAKRYRQYNISREGMPAPQG
jgi:hypothetical protein